MNSPESPFIVTRPAPDHQALMARLSDAGLPAIHCPAFDIERAPEALLAARIQSLGEFDIVIVTSPVAARLVAEQGIGPELRDVRFFAPGKGTASVLRRAGVACRFPETGGTSEHILAMPELAGAGAARLAIVGAPGGRGLLASELSAKGAIVETVYLYSRTPRPPTPGLTDALRRGCDPIVLISSRQAFEMITRALGKAWRQAWLDSRFVVSSGRLQRACIEAGASRTRLAAGAANEQMLAAAREAGWMQSGAPDAARPGDFR